MKTNGWEAALQRQRDCPHHRFSTDSVLEAHKKNPSTCAFVRGMSLRMLTLPHIIKTHVHPGKNVKSIGELHPQKMPGLQNERQEVENKTARKRAKRDSEHTSDNASNKVWKQTQGRSKTMSLPREVQTQWNQRLKLSEHRFKSSSGSVRESIQNMWVNRCQKQNPTLTKWAQQH